VSVIASLLRAIDRAEGDALVMHVGETPYVVTGSDHTELAANPLTFPAMSAMLEQLLPPVSREQLEEYGAVEFDLPVAGAADGISYSVVAARGGDDIWIELRRKKESPVEVPPIEEPQPVPDPEPVPQPAAVTEPAPKPRVAVVDLPATVAVEEPPPPPPIEDERDEEDEPEDVTQRFVLVSEAPPLVEPAEEAKEREIHVIASPPEPEPESARQPDQAPEPEPIVKAAPVLVPMPRPAVRLEHAPRQTRALTVQQVLRAAASRGASMVYLAADTAASIRVDGEIHVLEGVEPLTSAKLEAGIAEIMPAADRPALRTREHAEWPYDLADVGRINCVSYRDHRGVGAIVRMLPARAISSQQVGLSPQLQALCAEPEGLLLVAGSRSSGKSTLTAALVDQINRTRRDHVITVESSLQFLHDNRISFVSQREVRGDETAFASALRTAMREHPDVLVVDDVHHGEIAAQMLHAASSGHFVIGVVTAPSAADAVNRLIEMFPNDRREHVREELSLHLRGVVAQTLLRKTGGGRAAAREVLVNVPAVASLIGSGKTSELPGMLMSGRRLGMVPLNDALLALVQSGALDMREAYRKSPDQQELLTLLKREGVDTSFAERLA
jgi:twitching motility protein PilT